MVSYVGLSISVSRLLALQETPLGSLWDMVEIFIMTSRLLGLLSYQSGCPRGFSSWMEFFNSDLVSVVYLEFVFAFTWIWFYTAFANVCGQVVTSNASRFNQSAGTSITIPFQLYETTGASDLRRKVNLTFVVLGENPTLLAMDPEC